MKIILITSLLLTSVIASAWEFTKSDYAVNLQASGGDGPGSSYSWTKRIVEKIDGIYCVADHNNRDRLFYFSSYTRELDWQDCRAIIDAKKFKSALGHSCGINLRQTSYDGNRPGIQTSSSLVLTSDCICQYEKSGGAPFKGYSVTVGVNPFQCFEIMTAEEKALARKLVQPKPVVELTQTTKALVPETIE